MSSLLRASWEVVSQALFSCTQLSKYMTVTQVSPSWEQNTALSIWCWLFGHTECMKDGGMKASTRFQRRALEVRQCGAVLGCLLEGAVKVKLKIDRWLGDLVTQWPQELEPRVLQIQEWLNVCWLTPQAVNGASLQERPYRLKLTRSQDKTTQMPELDLQNIIVNDTKIQLLLIY